MPQSKIADLLWHEGEEQLHVVTEADGEHGEVADLVWHQREGDTEADHGQLSYQQDPHPLLRWQKMLERPKLK